MIKAKMKTKDGKDVLLLGITKENVTAMAEDKKPLNINLKELGLGDIDIVIHYNKTTRGLLKDLEPFIGPQTETRIGGGKGSFV